MKSNVISILIWNNTTDNSAVDFFSLIKFLGENLWNVLRQKQLTSDNWRCEILIFLFENIENFPEISFTFSFLKCQFLSTLPSDVVLDSLPFKKRCAEVKRRTFRFSSNYIFQHCIQSTFLIEELRW